MRSYKKYSIPFILIISYKTIFLIPPRLGTCRHLDLEHVVSYFLSYQMCKKRSEYFDLPQ